MADYRLRITSHSGTITYIVRRNGEIYYRGGDETPLALANLLQEQATEARFGLEDCINGATAKEIVLRCFKRAFPQTNSTPKIDVLL